jgi:transcriptional regulator
VYTPPFNTVHDESRVRDFVAEARTGWLVTVGPDGFPLATLLPIMWQADRVIAHLARANPQWRQLSPGSPGLIVVPGAQAYVSPSWYPAKAEHGKVVPTWNYSAVQLTGTVTVHEDPQWLRRAVTELTDTHEGTRPHPWQVTDAPAPYVDGQLGGIIGIEFAVIRAEGKSKLSQNRSEADRQGVVDGLRADVASRAVRGTHAAQADDIADEMAAALEATALG